MEAVHYNRPTHTYFNICLPATPAVIKKQVEDIRFHKADRHSDNTEQTVSVQNMQHLELLETYTVTTKQIYFVLK